MTTKDHPDASIRNVQIVYISLSDQDLWMAPYYIQVGLGRS